MINVPISAGIVTYNNEKEIGMCLKSLFDWTQNLDMEVYIYDNHSEDHTAAIIQKEFPQVHLIQGSENKGFGYGHNRILEQTVSQYHLVINPDIQFVEASVEKLVRFLEKNLGVGIVTPKIVNADGSEQFLPKKDPKFSYVILSKFKPFYHYRTEYTRAEETFEKPTRILSSTGCLFCIRTDLFKKNQGFDERFFMYFEDADLSRRIRKKADIVFYPGTEACHGWKRANMKSLRGIRIFLVSMMKYFWKWRK